jgi:hypothetical protein
MTDLRRAERRGGSSLLEARLDDVPYLNRRFSRLDGVSTSDARA